MTSNPGTDERLRQIVGENSELKTLLEQQNDVTRTALHQPIERFATLVARPTFILVSLALFILWILVNTTCSSTTFIPGTIHRTSGFRG